jgi:hypothetical protein
MPITSIKDALKAIAQSLQLSSVIPSFLIVLMTGFLFLPTFFPHSTRWSIENQLLDTILVFSIITISYLFYAFNFLLIRLFEGFLPENNILFSCLFEWLRQKKIEDFNYHKSLLKSEDRLIKTKAQRYLSNYYPSDPAYILPTRLGNVLAAFEDYPVTRYNINAISLWPRMIPLLQENKFIENVSNNKATFDLLLNLIVASAIVFFELFYICLFMHEICYLIVTLILFPFLLYYFYQGLIHAATAWGLTVQVAFDLYRKELSERMGLKPAKSFDQEKFIWREISKHIHYGKLVIDPFDYSKKEFENKPV